MKVFLSTFTGLDRVTLKGFRRSTYDLKSLLSLKMTSGKRVMTRYILNVFCEVCYSCLKKYCVQLPGWMYLQFRLTPSKVREGMGVGYLVQWSFE